MDKQKRIRDYGVKIGKLNTGKLNKITDVEGVRVGHTTINNVDHHTGVTIINPSINNIYLNKHVAASCVFNGFGKTTGLIQINELGQLESPIALTNTLNVGLVQDALVEHMIQQTSREGVEITSINTVVAECNDSYLNKIAERVVRHEQVVSALENTKLDFLEGSVGAGTGTSCHQLKGGIGSASRVFNLDGRTYTIGVLVQSNHGLLGDLTINGEHIGPVIQEKIKLEAEKDEGSIIIVVATDLPVTSRQLQRICKRASIGLARVGSYMGHGSGEIVIGFSTANVIRQSIEGSNPRSVLKWKVIREDEIDIAFRAVAETVEEAIINSLITADTVTGYHGNKRYSLKSFINLLNG